MFIDTLFLHAPVLTGMGMINSKELAPGDTTLAILFIHMSMIIFLGNIVIWRLKVHIRDNDDLRVNRKSGKRVALLIV